ncbi:MAG: DUF4405 domain-containing protein [Planctomycetaceae bacterium]
MSPTELNVDPPGPCVADPDKGETVRRCWSKTIVNFWLDATLLVLFVVLAWLVAVTRFVFPQRTDATGWTLWGGDIVDWHNAQFVVFCIFSAGVAVHVMLHWSWICGVVNTRIIKRKAIKEDGSDTLIGVGLIAAILHIIAIGLLLAMWGVKSP